MNPRLQALRAKRDGITERMTGIDESVALRSDLALTDEETQEYDKLRAALEQVNADIDALAEHSTRQAEVAATLATIDTSAEVSHPAHVRSEAVTVTPGEYVSLYFRAHLAESQTERDEANETLLRVVAETGTSDTTGVLPTPIVGDLVKFVDANRPIINAMRSMPMPDKGKSFTRPRVTQRTTAAAQTEKSQLSSTQLTTTGDTITKSTQGGILRLTEQDIDWSEPAMLQVAIQDLADSYAIQTETVAAAAIVTAATHTQALDITVAQAADFISAMASGSKQVYNNSKRLPDTLFAGVDAWAFLVSLVDADDRQLFPNLSPVNTPGTLGGVTSFAGNPMGLRLVVSPNFASASFLAIGTSFYVEAYEQNKGLITLPIPSVLEQEVAYRGYFATNVYAQGLCSLQ